MGSVLARSDRVYERCDFEKLKSMEDQFLNIEGTYYFSLNQTRVLEVLCMNTLNNAQVTLSGVGSIKIKNNCYAKLNSLLLTGSNTYSLNITFRISRVNESILDIEFSFLNNTNIDNLLMTNFNRSLNTNQINNNLYLHYHLISLYSVLTIFMMLLISFIFLTIFIYKNKKGCIKTKIDNEIPESVLELAKASRKKKSSE